jgi:hypothetical protein
MRIWISGQKGKEFEAEIGVKKDLVAYVYLLDWIFEIYV